MFAQDCTSGLAYFDLGFAKSFWHTRCKLAATHRGHRPLLAVLEVTRLEGVALLILRQKSSCLVSSLAV